MSDLCCLAEQPIVVKLLGYLFGLPELQHLDSELVEEALIWTANFASNDVVQY